MKSLYYLPANVFILLSQFDNLICLNALCHILHLASSISALKIDHSTISLLESKKKNGLKLTPPSTAMGGGVGFRPVLLTELMNMDGPVLLSGTGGEVSISNVVRGAENPQENVTLFQAVKMGVKN